MSTNSMQNVEVHDSANTSAKSTALKVGWVLTVLPCLLVLFSGAFKLISAPTPEMASGLQHVGIGLGMVKSIGVLEVLIAIVCLIPRTSFIGAILFTGWAGGAILTHWRVGDPFFIQALLPTVLWIGVGLRHRSEFRSLLGLRSL
jgi:DoxX-like family